MMEVNGKQFKELIPGDEVLEKINFLAKSISEEYKGLDPLILGVLNGSYLFFAELTKALDFEAQIGFIRYQSYAGTSSTGEFKITLPLPEEIRGRHVIIVEDIIDTGATLKKIMEDAASLEPASVEIATMLIKPKVFRNKYPVKYIGFEIPDKFVIGYGLDYDGRGRNLGDIMVLAD